MKLTDKVGHTSTYDSMTDYGVHFHMALLAYDPRTWAHGIDFQRMGHTCVHNIGCGISEHRMSLKGIWEYVGIWN